MIEIQKADNNQDILQIATLAEEIWHEHYLSIIGREQIVYMLEKFQSVEAINQQITAGYEYYLICHDQMTVGYFSVQQRLDKLFLSKLYVLQSFRGQGIGKQTMDFIQQSFPNFLVQLTVNKYNSASVAFYQAVGFTIVNSVVADIGHGFVMDDYVMERQL